MSVSSSSRGVSSELLSLINKELGKTETKEIFEIIHEQFKVLSNHL